MSGSGKTIVTGYMGLFRVTLNQRRLENAGTAGFCCELRQSHFYNNATFLNRVGAVFSDSMPADSIFYTDGTNTKFINEGTYIKKQGSTGFYVPFINTGMLDVQNGAIVIAGGGRNSGILKVAAAGGLNLGGGHIIGQLYRSYELESTTQISGAGHIYLNTLPMTFGHNFAFTGSLWINGGNVTFTTPVTLTALSIRGGPTTFNSTLTVPNVTIGYNSVPTSGELILVNDTTMPALKMSGGTLSGAGVVTVTNLTWDAGTMSGNGKTIVTGQTTFKLVRLHRPLEDTGTATWDAQGYPFYIGRDGRFLNRSGAIFNDISSGNSEIKEYFPSELGQFLNEGTYNKIGAGPTVNAIPITNTGTINIQSGTFSLNRDGTNAGLINLASSTTLDINNVFINQASGRISGTGTLDRSNATSFTNNGTIDPSVVVVPP